MISCKRLGKKDTEAKGVRPLLVTHHEETQVKKILREAKSLRDKEKYKGIYVKKDSTPLERQNLKRLLTLRDQRREDTKKKNGTEIWVIRNEDVVDISKAPSYAEILMRSGPKNTSNKEPDTQAQP